MNRTEPNSVYDWSPYDLKLTVTAHCHCKTIAIPLQACPLFLDDNLDEHYCHCLQKIYSFSTSDVSTILTSENNSLFLASENISSLQEFSRT